MATLAIVDGRFLPVDYLKIKTDKEAKTIQKIGSNSFDMTTRAATIDVGIRTKRPPKVRDGMVQRVYIRDEEYKITVEDAHVTKSGATMSGFEAAYDIELSADSYSITRATATFL